MKSLELQQKSYNEEEQTVHACVTLIRANRPQLTSCLAQCPLQFEATIALNSLKILGKLT